MSKQEENVRVKLDGDFVWFKSVYISNRPLSNTLLPRQEIRLVLENDEVIYDDGTRVEVIFFCHGINKV